MDWSRMLPDDPPACGLQQPKSQLQEMVLLLAFWWIKGRTRPFTLIQGMVKVHLARKFSALEYLISAAS